MRVPLAAVLCLLAVVPALGREDPADPPWGETVAGLRCRANVPARIEEDLPLPVTIEFAGIPDGLEEGVSRLRTAMAAAFLTLELVHVEKRTTLEVWPYDPSRGRPFSFEGRTEAPLDGSPIERIEVTFPIATAVVTSQMTTAGLEPGAYEARIRFTYPGPVTRWPASRAEREGEGSWRGTVVTGPFPLQVEKPPSRTRKILVPRRLRLGENRVVIFTPEDAEEIEIKARNGHFVLAEFSRDGRRTRTVEMPAPGTAIDGWGRHPGAIAATYEIRIVQTPWPPAHGWRTGPRRGGSTFVEWRRSYELRGPATGAAAPAQALPLPEGARLRLGSLRLRHPEDIRAVAVSPDGRFVATASYVFPGGRIRIWESGSGRLVREIPGLATTLEFSPDGQRLATNAFGTQVDLHDVGRGERIATVPMVPFPEGGMGSIGGGPGGISCVRFSPDGRRMALGGRVAETQFGPGDEDSRTVIRQLTLVDLETGRELRHFVHEDGVRDAAFSPDGTLLASADGETVRLWDTETGALRIEAAPWSNPHRLRFTPDGTQLLVATEGGFGVLDPRTGKELFFRGALGSHVSLAVNGDGSRVAAGGYQSIRLWDPRTWEPVAEFRAARRGVGSLAFAGDLLVSTDGPVLRVWDPEWGNPIMRPEGHEAAVRSLIFFPDGKTLASASSDATVRLWDATTGEARAVLRDNHTTVHAMALSPDAKTLAIADYFGVRLSDAVDGKNLGRGWLRARLNGRALAFSPDGKTLAIGGASGSIVFWDLAARRARHRVELPEGHLGSIGSIAYSPDGSILAANPSNAEAFLCDPAGTRPGHVIHAGRGLLGGSHHLTFSPDGTSLLCVGHEARVRDVATTEVRLTLSTPGDGSNGGVGAWSPDGRTIATAVGDAPIQLWDATTGRALASLKGHEGRVTALAFSPDGKTLASGGADTTVLVWDVPKN